MEIKIPQDSKLEALCLGAILKEGDCSNVAFSSLDDSDFFCGDHKRIFGFMREMFKANEEVNVATALFKMRKEKEEGNFSRDYFHYLDSSAWFGMDYQNYFEELKNITGLRKSCYAAQDLLMKICKEGARHDEVLATHQNALLQTMTSNNSTFTGDSLFSNFRGKSFEEHLLWKKERYGKGLPSYQGVESKYPLLDKKLGSFQNGALYYIGARTSMGKTTFILNLMAQMIKTKKIGMFSLEMSAEMIFEKLLCILCDLKYSDVSIGKFSEDNFQKLKSLRDFFSLDCLFIEDQRGISISKLAARAKRMKQNFGIEILFVDYLTFIKSDTKYSNKHLQVDEVSKGLQSLAKILDIPIVCLAQLNRSAAGDEKTRPSLAQFRESGSIEEDADACLLIHRPDYYNKNEKPGMIEIIVAKNRIMGTVGTIEYSCNPSLSDRYFENESICDEMKRIQARENQKRYEKDFDEGWEK